MVVKGALHGGISLGKQNHQFEQNLGIFKNGEAQNKGPKMGGARAIPY